MGLPDDLEKKLSKQHNEICKALNLDKSSASEAWKNLLQISDSYILEGEPIHWLGCTLYIACKSSFTPTVSKPNVVVQGNLVSLTRLLRVIDLSLIEFFVKMRRCSTLLSLPDDFREHMDKLEKNFNVSMVLFRKFQPIFSDVFRMENTDAQKPGHKAKKLKTHPPTCWRIKDFTWILFICIKATVSNITDDLVNSYHLLLACIDFVYVNVVASGRKEMLSEGVVSLTQDKSRYSDVAELPCIVDYLCAKHDGISVDVKSMKEYVLRKNVKKLFENKVLRGNNELMTDVMEFTTFESNMKSLGKFYEEYTLSLGGVDERVFLGYSSNMCNIGNFGTYGGGNAQEIGEQLEARRKQNAQQGKSGPPLTPLSGKRYLKHSDGVTVSGHSSISLQSALSSRDPGPTEFTREVIRNCSNPPVLTDKVDALSATLHSALTASINSDDRAANKEARNVTDFSAKLFYKFLDSILPGETKKPAFDPNSMLNNEVLIKALFACAAEVVLYASKLQKKFPWILEVLNLPSYYCYKVIEVIVTYDDILSRDLVKHLNSVEESILESLAWSSNSPLWKALVESGLPVPSCEDVSQEGAIEVTEVTSGNKGVDKLAELASGSSILTNSPGAPLADKFMSPIKGKRPHPADSSGHPPQKTVAVSKPDGLVKAESSDKSEDAPQNGDVKTEPLKENKRPKRTGSTSLFFRKFYYLAVVRMLDMCNQLGLSDIELRRKIWTCFELTIVNRVGLMWNRHLDQLLMCSIYVICKVVGNDPSFMIMMKCYRNQPQAQSHVYRQVLIKPDKTLENIKNDLSRPVEVVEERGDIIRFYNEVFIHKVKELTRKFRSSSENDRIVLSPILVGKCTPVNGPRRVSEKHPLYLRALLPRSPGSGTQLHYHFNRSPAKDLHAINTMVARAKPKILKDDSPEGKDAPPNSISQKVKDIYADRISLEKQDLEKQN